MATAALAPSLARKVKQVMETRPEAPEVAGALATLSELYPDNTAAGRRRLRTTVETEGVRVNEQFLGAAQSVIQMLDVVQSDLGSLSTCCERMGSALAGSRSTAADLLHDTDRLQRALQVSETRSQLVSRFLEQYQLTAAETAALQSEEVGPAFFGALAHVRHIHANCKALLRTHHQRAGLELMDTMSSLQEAAYERLCRWVQQECLQLSEADDDAPEVEAHPTLQQAAVALRERPVLFKYCAEEVAQARHTALFQRFIKALTRVPRPIEAHAHDPRRYVSDMLAWVHSAVASEREFLAALFGEGAEGSEGTAGAAAQQRSSSCALQHDDSSGAEGVPTIQQLLDAVFESICRPLKVRVEQVVMSSPPPLLCFRLSQLLAFYLSTVEGLLGAGSQLAEALRSCRAMSLRALHDQLRQRGDKAQRYAPQPPPDLAPPQQLVEGAQLLADLIASYEHESMDAQQQQQQLAGGADADFAAVLAAVVDPLVEMCARSSEALNPLAASRVDEGAHLGPTDQAAYLVNCTFLLAAPLAGHACAVAQAHALHAALEAHVAAVVAAEVRRTLSKCRGGDGSDVGGLAELAERMQQLQDQGQAPAGDAALALPRVAAALRAFFARLSDPAQLPELPKLQVPRLKAEATQRVLQALADTYASVHAGLLAPGSGYEPAEVAEAVRHTPAQVRTLLGVV